MAKISPEKAQKIISECKKDMASWYDWFSRNNERWRENTLFYYGEQWDAETREDYRLKKRPTLVVDLIGPNIRKAMGQQKNADITVNLLPKNEEIDSNSFELLTGLIRDILYDNHSQEAFNNVFENQLVGAYGVLKIGTDYDSEMSFDQKITIETEKQPTNVFFDRLAKQNSKNDGNYCGSYEILSKEDFETLYPKATFPTASILPTSAPQWLEGDRNVAVIVEYYKKDYRTKTLIELTNNIDFKREVLLDDREEIEAEYYALMEEQGMSLVTIPPLEETNRRSTQIAYIKCYKLTSAEVLDVYEWPLKKLPYLFIGGESLWVDGRQELKSFVAHAIDAQRIYNYVMSEIAYGLKTMRKERFLMTPKQLEGYEYQYRYPEKIQGALLYNYDQQAGKPEQISPQQLSPSYFSTSEIAAADIQKTLGMIDPVNGGIVNGASGQAIGRTIAEQNLNLVNYEQNLYDAIEEAGRILLALIPHIYDTERVVSIVDSEGQQQRVSVNTYDENDAPKNHLGDIVDNVYDLKVEANLSDEAESLLQHQLVMTLAQDPQVRPYIIDLLGKTTKAGIGPELTERLSYLVPPFVKAGEPAPPPMPPPPDPMMQLKQAEMEQKERSLMMDMNEKTQQHQLDLEKIELQKQTLLSNQAKAELQSATELEAARINAVPQMVKAHADLQSAIKDTRKLN